MSFTMFLQLIVLLLQAQYIQLHDFVWDLQLDFSNHFVKVDGSNVRLRAFEKLKPYYVHKLKERNTCACKYHVEMVKL